MSNVTTTARPRPASSSLATIYNLSMPLANTEYSQALSNGTKKVMIRVRGKHKAQVSFVSGDSGILYFTLEAGAVYFEDNLDLSGAIIYMQTNAAGQVAEILEWT